MLTPTEAVAGILQHISTLEAENVDLADALNRILAEPVVSPITLPHWDNSAMDGYAVLASDVRGATKENPVQLHVTETIAAGAFGTLKVSAGLAARIMTGAPMPDGADTVIRSEDTDSGTEVVEIYDDRDAGRNIRARGEDLSAEEEVLGTGQHLGAAQLGILSSVGAASVRVYARPRVGIAGSGDELVDLDRFDEVLAGRKIISSNSYTLSALVTLNGGIPVNLGIARDTLQDMRATLQRGLDAGCDLILTSAGVSVGEFDYTRAALTELGAELKFWKVRMRPGAPLGFGLLGRTPWIGLPGNPVSAMVTFELFVRPALLRMQGYQSLFRRPVQVRLEEDISTGARLTHFLRAIVRNTSEGHFARLTGPQGSGILTSMSRANALLVVPEDCRSAPAGSTLNAILLNESAELTADFSL